MCVHPLPLVLANVGSALTWWRLNSDVPVARHLKVGALLCHRRVAACEAPSQHEVADLGEHGLSCFCAIDSLCCLTIRKFDVVKAWKETGLKAMPILIGAQNGAFASKVTKKIVAADASSETNV